MGILLKQKGFESLGSGFVIFEKKKFFVLGPWGRKIVIFRKFTKIFSELLDSN